MYSSRHASRDSEPRDVARAAVLPVCIRSCRALADCAGRATNRNARTCGTLLVVIMRALRSVPLALAGVVTLAVACGSRTNVYLPPPVDAAGPDVTVADADAPEVSSMLPPHPRATGKAAQRA